MTKRTPVLTCAILLLLNCSLVSWSQDAAKPAAKDAEPAKKATNRLPSNYGKLGLTDAQRDKVYSINEKYDAQLDALEDQIKALRAKRTAETEGVLTAEQKKILKDLTDDAKDKDAKSKSKKSEKSDKDATGAKEKK